MIAAGVPADADRLRVAASIVPVQTFVERVGGDRVDVAVVVGPDASPATYELRARQMADLSEATALFRIGAPFESAWLPRLRAANPDMAIVDLRERIKLRRMASHGHADHDTHGSGGDPDPHLWTDPQNVIRVAAHIRDRLIALDPGGEAAYRANYRAFRNELEALHQALKQRFAPLSGEPFLVYHPAWGYFADAYGLEQLTVETEGKEPGARSLDRIIQRAREAGIRVVFVQDQFNKRSAARVAEAVGARVVTVDPLAADYIANMRRVGRLIAEGVAP
jgi:zinc transport system substrate-binding protein